MQVSLDKSTDANYAHYCSGSASSTLIVIKMQYN